MATDAATAAITATRTRNPERPARLVRHDNCSQPCRTFGSVVVHSLTRMVRAKERGFAFGRPEVDKQGIVLIHLILSLDYEVFGNGAGDVMRDVVQPTRRLLDLCEKHGAKMTIMFEVGEYWAFERYDSRLRPDLGYSPCAVMKTQAAEAMERGHDVQLHLHPQWVGAGYDQGVWKLRHSCWRLADLPDGMGSEEQATSITGVLSRGKQTLEDLLKPVKADYECVCFRAGGFLAQPSRDIIRAMKRVGLRADSSVVKGYRTDRPFTVDYSGAATARAAWWTTDTELTEEGTPGENVIELSVNSRMEPYWTSFKKTKLQAAWQRRKIEKTWGGGDATGQHLSSVPAGRTVLKNLFKKHASTFDFCKLSCQDMLKRLQGLDDPQQQPVVMIGHSKDFINDHQFEEFLATLSRSRSVRFMSVSESIHEMLSARRISRPTAMAREASRRSERP